MKALTLLLFLIFMGINVNAQSIFVSKINKLEIAHSVYFPKFGISNDEILFSGEQYKGLFQYNLNTNTVTTISTHIGSGNNPKVFDDGSILFKETTYNKGRKSSVTKLYNQGTITNNYKTDATDNTVSAEGKKLVISTSQGIKSVSPIPDGFYIWPSVSPDKTMILFTVAGKGTYIMNFNGEVLYELGYLNAPKWLNNNWVVGMNDIDDGHLVTKSDIIAVNLDTQVRFNLTENANLDKPMYPEPSPKGNCIVFKAADGYVYLMDLVFND